MTKQVQLSTNNETLINQNTQLSQTFEELDSKEEESIKCNKKVNSKQTPLKVEIKFLNKGPETGRKIRIVVVSDTHNLHQLIPVIPDGDIFISCGDFTDKNDWKKKRIPHTVKDFNEWLGSLPHKHKIVIAGNHEIGFNSLTKEKIQKKILTNCIYLQDSEVVVEGIRFYGTPWTTSRNMAFSCSRDSIGKKWDAIPKDIDILITHLPPKNIFDLTEDGHWGNSDLRNQILNRIKPKVHLFGHVHQRGQSWTTIDNVNFINAAISTDRIPPVRCPVYFDYFV